MTATTSSSAALHAALARAGGGAAAAALSGLLVAGRGGTGTCGTDTPAQAPAPVAPMLSLQQVIFDPGRFISGPVISVRGSIVVLDRNLGRFDLSHEGAKLIVSTKKLEDQELKDLEIGCSIVATGRLLKDGRRMFLEVLALAKD